MTPKVVWPAAILFYLLFIAGLLVFAVRPALAAGAPVKALAPRRAARPHLVRHLRPDQPGHAQGLAGHRHGHRSHLGNGPRRRGVVAERPGRPEPAQALTPGAGPPVSGRRGRRRPGRP
ncbi:MAG: DUF2177 family protein [Ignavibacteriales bacterium]|nr:DUF2177 family protein [Ignavibacteriales bacterium]